MAETIIVTAQDATFIRLETTPAINRELTEHFSFEVPGARYMPAVKAHRWDGRIRLYRRSLLFVGLISALEDFCSERHYKLVLVEGIEPSHPVYKTGPLPLRLNQPLAARAGFEPATHNLTGCRTTTVLPGNIPKEFTPRDYQLQAFEHGLVNSRSLFLSATGSGKTLVIYLLSRYYEQQGKVLIIVPTTSLVHQGLEDFRKYGCHSNVQGIVGGETREVLSPITFSTWQSIMQEQSTWMEQFATVIVDEAHGAKSNSLQSILTAATKAYNRFGFTATLSGAKTHEMILTGLIGPVYKASTAKGLMKAGVLAQADIRMIILQHPDKARKSCPKDYQDEILYLVQCEPRNDFLTNLALSTKGNTLVLYTRVAQHGKILFNKIQARADGDRQVHFLHGAVDGENRNEVRKIVEKAENDIIVASYGVFSQGIDITRLHNIIFSSPYKSRILVPQSIGRGLRKADDKVSCRIYDVVDDLSWHKHRNYAMKHAESRLKIYAEQGFDFSSYQVGLDYQTINTQARRVECSSISS